MRAKKGQVVDHINLNTLDNSRNNLRLCDYSSNTTNRKKHKNNTSGYKGVSKAGKKWKVNISKNGKRYYLGLFSCKKEAALEYNKAALKLHGKFARLNPIKEV